MTMTDPEKRNASSKRSWRLISLVLVLSVAVLFAGCATLREGAEKPEPVITKGPVLLRVYQDRAALMWETESEGTCKLYYGMPKETKKFVESSPEKISYQVKRNRKTTKKVAYIHKVWIEGLRPGEVYEYYITAGRVNRGVYRLRTIPEANDSVRFVVYGDSRTYPETHRKLVEQIIKEKVDFVVHLGDLVTNGNNYQQWGPQHFDVVKGLAEEVPMYVVKGNHEGNNGNYEKLFVPPGEKDCFSFDYGPVHFFGGDNVSRGRNPKELLEMFTRDAQASKAEWKFACFHIPSLNFGHHWSAWGYPDALPTFSEARIDFVFAGHSHLYERFRPIKPEQGRGSYVTYITSGGGGAELGRVERTKYHMYAESTHEFCLFEVKGNKLRMDVINAEGKTIDSLRLTKTGDRLEEDYLENAVAMEDVMRFQEANLHKKH